MNSNVIHRLNRAQKMALIAGSIGTIALILGVLLNARQFFISYLFAWFFWIGLSLGCLCVAMIHHLTGGRWGDVTRRFLEAGYSTVPLMVILFTPLLFGLRTLYPWARPDEVAHNAILQHKAHYLNMGGYVGRSLFHFAIWISMAVLLRKWSLRQDQTTDLTPTRQARTLSGPGVVIYALTMTFASIDWLMSLEPDWYSTMFPVIICGGQILAAFALAILALTAFRREAPYAGLLQEGHFRDLGNLLLTFVMFWTYVGFGQLLVIWSGNLPHEIVWYLHRIAGGWKWVAASLALFNFFLPFFLLLFRGTKRNIPALACLAALVFVCQILNSYWMVEPTFFPHGLHVHWLDFAAVLAVGSWWFTAFATVLKRAGLLVKNDPRISHSFANA